MPSSSQPSRNGDVRKPTLRLQLVGGALAIAAITTVVYFPSLIGGFIFDDNLLLTDNPLIKSSDGVFRFWYTTEQADYVPLTLTTLWFEWRLWGLNPSGYHVANLALHIAGCLLIWAVLQKLSIRGAFLAALLYAVHPVNVESVAWVEQRKDLLALLFFLLSIYWYLSAEEKDGSNAGCGFWYWLSLLAFLMALFSKGSVVFLPAVLLLIVWWQGGRIRRRDLARTVPFFLVAAIFVPVVIWFVGHGWGEVVRNVDFTQRLLGAGGVVWFYLSKALLPVRLIFFYPEWDIPPNDLLWWLPLIAGALVTGLLARQLSARAGTWVRPLLFAWGFYCLALLPAMGFSDAGYMKYSLVADHYQHIALVGVVALAGAAWSAWREKTSDARWSKANITAWILVIALSLLSWRQNWLYSDALVLYQSTVIANPNSWIAQNLLGVALNERGHTEAAIEHLQQGVRLKPDSAEAHNNFGVGLFQAGRTSEALDQYREALKLKAGYADAYNNLGYAMLSLGNLPEAFEHYQQAVQYKPDFAEAYNGLGTAARMLNRLPQAFQYYRRALSIDPEYARAWGNLAVAYAQANRPVDAIANAQKAVELARVQGKLELAQQIDAWLQSYRSGRANSSNESSDSRKSEQP